MTNEYLKALEDLRASVEIDTTSTSDDGESYMVLGNVDVGTLRQLGFDVPEPEPEPGPYELLNLKQVNDQLALAEEALVARPPESRAQLFDEIVTLTVRRMELVKQYKEGL
jgi:hypothetical protein